MNPPFLPVRFFLGIVESRSDPKKACRVKVRVFAIHNSDKNQIPTEDLPWATLLAPTGAPTMKPPREGSWVWGFFADGNLAQQPMVCGLVVGLRPDSFPNSDSEGFYDSGDNLDKRPKVVTNRNVSTSGSDSTLEDRNPKKYPQELSSEEPISPKSSRGEIHSANEHKKNTAISGMESATKPNETVLGWYEPTDNFKGKYPYVSAVETESGHLQEFDDTPGAERIHTFHRTGTFDEMLADGSRISKTVGNQFNVAHGHLFCATFGEVTQNVLKSFRILSKEDTIINSDRHVYISSFGNTAIRSYGEITLSGSSVHLGSKNVDGDVKANKSEEEPVVLGYKLAQFLELLLIYIDAHTHATPAGPSSPARVSPIGAIAGGFIPPPLGAKSMDAIMTRLTLEDKDTGWIKDELVNLLSQIVSTR